MSKDATPLTSFTVTFNTDAETATTTIDAPSPQAALAEAHTIRTDKARLGRLFFQPWEKCPVNEIIIGDDDDDEVALWRDEDLMLRLAASSLFEALERALTALDTAPRFDVPALDCDSYAVAAECQQAIARARARTEAQPDPA